MTPENKKQFCPNCEAETPCTHEAELYVCEICGEDFAKYIVSRNCNVSDVSVTQDVSTDSENDQSIENTNPDYYKQEIARLNEIIARLKEALPTFKRGHYYCDDCWYSCPKAEDGCCDERAGEDCNCGADEWNARIDLLMKELEVSIDVKPVKRDLSDAEIEELGAQ